MHPFTHYKPTLSTPLCPTGLPLNKSARTRWDFVVAVLAFVPVLLFVAFQMVSALTHHTDGAFVGTCLLILTSNLNVRRLSAGLFVPQFVHSCIVSCSNHQPPAQPPFRTGNTQVHNVCGESARPAGAAVDRSAEHGGGHARRSGATITAQVHTHRQLDDGGYCEQFCARLSAGNLWHVCVQSGDGAMD